MIHDRLPLRGEGEYDPYACPVCGLHDDCVCPSDSETQSSEAVSEQDRNRTPRQANVAGSETISLMPEPFGINEVLQHFKRVYAPTLLVEPLPPPTEES